MRKFDKKPPKKDDLVNEDIKFREVLLVGENGPIGKMSSNEALVIAKDQGLDLVAISPNASPPVVKALDYGKYKFNKAKNKKAAKKKQTIMQIKEVRITPQIDQHDLETKTKQARKFLEQGNKVKVSLKFRGRQMTHKELGAETLKRFAALVEDIGKVEKSPVLTGRFLDMVIGPIKKTKK